MKFLTLGLVLIILLAGCSPSGRATQTATFISPPVIIETVDPLQDDFAVYMTVLTAVYGSQKTWFISRSTSTMGTFFPETALPGLEPETMTDYVMGDSTGHPLEAVFAGKGSEIVLVNQADFFEKATAENGLVCYGGKACFNQRKFDAAYPGASHIIDLSKVGYNRSRTQALVTTHTVDKRVSGTLYELLLTKENGAWRIEAQSEATWID